MEMFQEDEKNIIGSEVSARTKIALDSPGINWAMGGGFYQGYTVCLYGPEQGGKSFLSMCGLGALHRFDPDAIGVTISSEFRPPVPERAAKLGVDPKRHMIRQANTIHDIFDWIVSRDPKFKSSDGKTGGPGLLYMLEQGAPIKYLGIDSIKGIRGPKEVKATSMSSTNQIGSQGAKGGAEKMDMGDLSRFLNPALREILPVIRQYNIMTVFVQQVNENMNADEVEYQGIKWKIPCGQALKHFCEHMVLVERINNKDSKIFSDQMILNGSPKASSEVSIQEGHTIRATVSKANLDSPFRTAEFQVKYNTGIVNQGLEVAKLATGTGAVYHPFSEQTKKEIANKEPPKVNNAWWAAVLDGQEVKWNGFDNLVEDLNAKPELQRALMAEVYKKTS